MLFHSRRCIQSEDTKTGICLKGFLPPPTNRQLDCSRNFAFKQISSLTCCLWKYTHTTGAKSELNLTTFNNSCQQSSGKDAHECPADPSHTPHPSLPIPEKARDRNTKSYSFLTEDSRLTWLFFGHFFHVVVDNPPPAPHSTSAKP